MTLPGLLLRPMSFVENYNTQSMVYILIIFGVTLTVGNDNYDTMHGQLFGVVNRVLTGIHVKRSVFWLYIFTPHAFIKRCGDTLL